MAECSALSEQPEPEGLAAFAWAKSLDDGLSWMPLWRHLDDTAAVADQLWSTRLSTSQRQLLATDFGSEDVARRIAIWLANVHDIGKASAAFALQVPQLRFAMESAGYGFHSITEDERRAAPHGLVGKLAIEEWFAQKGVRTATARVLATIVGGHHGVFPEVPLGLARRPIAVQGESAEWAEVRFELLERAARVAGLDFSLVQGRSLGQASQVILAGFLIQCDWIASNAEYFPLGARGAAVDWMAGGATRRAKQAIEAIDLPAPWCPEAQTIDEAWFRNRFGLPSDAVPRPSQLALIRAAESCTAPSLLILEAPTGEGKTEAALAAAEVLAAKFGLAGVFVGLPTRATSDAMFSRVLSWMGSALPVGARVSTMLSHGLAEFNDEFAGLARTARQLAPIYDANDSAATHKSHENAVAHWWLRGRKTSALADFVVGTIDQLLFLALKSRHLVLRHLGMSGKVVILDELHAADDFMLVYLERALEWLAAEGVPVIGLSATLPPERRRSLLAAYERGRARAAGMACFDDDAMTHEIDEVTDRRDYPLVLVTDGMNSRAITCEPSTRRSEFDIEVIGDELDDLVARVCDDVEGGGCVAVVRNTVARAQEVYAKLRERFPGNEVVLLHSRFLARDRRELEQRIVSALGAPGDRPHRLIVCATQVIEQSLDLDFDRMYTDWAPMDLVIQRAGRVHRHARPVNARPERLREARLVITGVDLLDAPTPPRLERGSAAIYGDATLLRSAAALGRHMRANGNVFVSPDHVAALVREAYDPATRCPVGWEEVWGMADERHKARTKAKRDSASNFVIPAPQAGRLEDWSRLSAGEAQEDVGRAQVRDADETITVVAVQRLNGVLHAMPWLPAPYGGARLDDLEVPDELAKAVAQCSVGLPAAVLRGDAAHINAVIDALEANGQQNWQNSRWLRGAIPLVFDEECSLEMSNVRLSYDRQLGLQHVVVKEQA